MTFCPSMKPYLNIAEDVKNVPADADETTWANAMKANGSLSPGCCGVCRAC